MEELEVRLRPNTNDVHRVYTQNSQIWSSCARESYLQREFQPGILFLQNMLGRVPPYLGYNLVGIQEQKEKPKFEHYTNTFPNCLKVLYMDGQSL